MIRGTGGVNISFEEYDKKDIDLYIEPTQENCKNFAKQLCKTNQETNLCKFKKSSKISKEFTKLCIDNKVVINLYKPHIGDYIISLYRYSINQFPYNNNLYLKIDSESLTKETNIPTDWQEIKCSDFYAIKDNYKKRSVIIMLTIAFSGHRPNNKSMGGYDWHSPKNELIMKKLKFTIVNLINCKEEKEVTFITGGALGIDQMAFDIVEDIKLNPPIQLKYINIKQILAMPFKNQDAKWFNPLDIDELKHEQCVADEVVLVDKLDRYKIKGYQEDIYYPAKMQKRNEWMIDNCDILIAVWDGSRGGTCNCVKYCKKQNKEIIRINPSNLSEVSIC